MSIRSKLYLALFSAVFLVTLTLLFFLQYSVGSFESYVSEIDARILKQVAERLEQQYDDNDDRGWSFLEDDLQSWLLAEEVFAEVGPFPGMFVRQRPMERERSFASLNNANFQPRPAPPSFRGEGNFMPPQSFQERLALQDADGNYIAGSIEEKTASNYEILHQNGNVIGRLELLVVEPRNAFPSMWAPPEMDSVPILENNGSYVSDLVSRSRFMTLQTRIFIILVLASITVLLLLGLPLARHFTKRIDDINLAANRLSKGDFSTRIVARGRDELSQLATNFNFLAEVMQKNKSSQQMWVSNISHELRTPLGILKGELEAVQDGVRSADLEHIAMLCNEVEQLNILVNDLFELSMSDLGGMAYENDYLSIAQIVEESLARFNDQCKALNLSVQINTAAADLVCVFGDSQRLRQLFSNLIQNSIKYTHSGGLIRISIESSAETVSVVIEDSAPGVPTEQLERLFERFYRGEKSRNRTTGGAGLGLAICKSIAESHQASIRAEHSTLGGIAINIIFPRMKQSL